MFPEIIECKPPPEGIFSDLVADGISRLRHKEAFIDVKHLVEDAGNMKSEGRAGNDLIS